MRKHVLRFICIVHSMQWPSVTVFRVSLPQESVSASVKTRTRVAVDLVLDSVTFAAELRNSEALDF